MDRRSGRWMVLLVLGVALAACGGEGADRGDPGGDVADVPAFWDPDQGAGPGDPDVVFGSGDVPEGWGEGLGPEDLGVPLCTPNPCDPEALEVCDPGTGDCVCTPDACDIDGVCHPDGVTAPGNNCLVCDVEATATGWTDLDGIFCDDGSVCTSGDHCAGGACVGEVMDCGDGNPCTTDTCDPVDGCAHVVSSQPCDDGNPCTADDTCAGGICVGTGVSCDDGSACTTDSCDPGSGCVNTTVVCDDGDACTADSCDPAQGCLAVPVTCDDQDACTSDSCDPAQGCVHPALDCDDGSVCTSDGCDPAQGCVYIDVDCDDGNPCTEDACTSVSGCLHSATNCSDGEPCTVDTCDPAQGCVHAALVCDDGDLCTVDACAQGQGCVTTPLDCDDGDPCTEDACQAGVGCVHPLLSCDDGDPCSVDTCDPILGCQHSGTVEVCDGIDNDCNGLVDDLPGVAPTIWFLETFANNGQAWTLDPSWAIGATAVSAGQEYGGPDPAHDATDTSDDGVAGVVPGGNTPKDLHGFYYLTSPVVDVSGAPGAVHVGYRRWLNSDYAPFMTNTVEVFDGAAWQVVWQTAEPPAVQDSEWMRVSHDLTAYKNKDLRVRFGYAVESAGVFSVAGWNVDDVVISDHPDLDLVLFDDFGAEGLGWVPGTTWAIGATAPSAGQTYGGPDPTVDHSPGGDNRVAGVMLGGVTSPGQHDWYWLTSPTRDTTTFGSTYLRYWRWLNSDYLPYMGNRVEVWDGAAWQVLWETGGSPGVQDSAWTLLVHDLTPYANASLQVRFGYMIGADGVYPVSSWNIDDVAIVEGLSPCD